MLDKCDIFNHSTYQVLTQIMQIQGYENFLEGKDIIHAGSHNLLEADIYDHFKAKRVYCFEANKLIFPELLERIGNRPGYHGYCTALWSCAGKELPFYFYRNKTDGAGGLFEDDKMHEYVTDCPQLEEKTTVITNTIDNYINDGIIDISNVSFLNIDLQGAELEAFKGGHELLISPSLKCIYCEVSWGPVYKGGPQQNDIVDYLSKYNFHFVGKREDWQIHGDAIFLR